MTELAPWDLADPGRLVTEALDMRALSDGETLLALVRHPSTEQVLRRVRRVALPTGCADWDRSEYLRTQAERLRVPRSFPLEHAIITITVRRGFTVLGRREAEWLAAWRFANALVDAFTGDLILVTEHGWYHFMSERGGRLPCLATSATS